MALAGGGAGAIFVTGVIFPRYFPVIKRLLGRLPGAGGHGDEILTPVTMPLNSPYFAGRWVGGRRGWTWRCGGSRRAWKRGRASGFRLMKSLERMKNKRQFVK